MNQKDCANPWSHVMSLSNKRGYLRYPPILLGIVSRPLFPAGLHTYCSPAPVGLEKSSDNVPHRIRQTIEWVPLVYVRTTWSARWGGFRPCHYESLPQTERLAGLGILCPRCLLA